MKDSDIDCDSDEELEYEDSDATFKCKANLDGRDPCGATELSFREYVISACCESAADLSFLNRMYLMILNLSFLRI